MKTFLSALIIAIGIISFVNLQKPQAISENIPSEKKKVRTEKFESKTEAIDALQFLSASYAYPNKDIPEDAFGKAYEFYRENFLNEENKTEITGTWQNIGPTNVGGRTLCVVLDPTDTSTVWLGSASGGLWKSTTGGIGTNAWTYIPTGFPTLGVSTIAFQPGNSQTMIIGTGETYAYGVSTNGLIDRTTRGTFGIGILKSTDGGATWSQVLNWTYLQNRGVWDIKFNPLKPSIVYASTTEGIYKSTDGGNTWNNVLNVQMAMNLLIDPVDTNIIYCGVGNLSSPNKGLYKTSNSGASWNILTNGLPSNSNRTGRIILAMNPLNHKTILAHICNAFNTQSFYISYNQGANWLSRSPQDIATYQGWYSNGLVFDPSDTNHIIAAGVNLHSSNDQANNFSQISNNNWTTDYSHSDVHDVIVNPLDPNKIYVATDGGLFRSDDMGINYYECTGGYVTTQFYIGSVSSQNPNLALAGAQDNWTWQYTGTSTWNGNIGGDGCYSSINPANDNIQFGSLQFMNIFKSTDGGVNFNQVLSSPASALGGNPTAFLAPFVLCPSNTQVLYTGGDSIVKSTNGGGSWNMIGPNPLDSKNIILSIGVSSTNKDSLYVGTAPTQTTAHVFRSTNGGTSFTNVTGTLPNRYPRRITVDPTNSKIVYVIFSGFGTGHIYKSTNAGNSWTDISTSLPNLPFHCLAVDPFNPNTIFAGCDLGIFYSADGGNTWNSFNSGFPDAVMVFDLVVSPSDNTLLAFTHGHGVYKRDLSDASGVGEFHASDLRLTVYPNPANSFVNFEFTKTKNLQGEISIYNLSGQKLISKTVTGKNEIEVDIKSFAEGIYFAKLSLGNKSMSRKFVVMK